MTSNARPRDASGLYWGWIIAAAGFAVTLTVGETLSSFGVFLKPLESEFNWSRALTSTAYSAFLLGYAISVVVAGRLSDRRSPRSVLLVCAVLAGGGMTLSCLATDINHLRAFLFISGLGSGGTWSVPLAVVQRWFRNRPRAGLALSVVSCGSAIGMMVYPPLVNYLISAYSWRTAYLVMGALLFGVTTTGALLMGRSPERAVPIAAGPNRVAGPQIPVKRLILSSLFLRLTFAQVIGTVVFQSISSHLMPYATDGGISPTVAVFALSLIGGLSLPARVVSGVAADRFGWRQVFAISLLGLFIALVLLVVFKGTGALYLFVAVFGISHGVRVIAQTGILGEVFGTASLGLLIGITSGIAQFFSVAAPYFCGFVYDQTGSYFIAFGSLAVLSLAASLVIFALRTTRFEAGPASEAATGSR